MDKIEIEQTLTPTQLTTFREFYKRLSKVLVPEEKLLIWLQKPSKRFPKSPLDCIRSGRVDRLERTIYHLESGEPFW
jgi:hypothetical protein